jgi:hypothetical protein
MDVVGEFDDVEVAGASDEDVVGAYDLNVLEASCRMVVVLGIVEW